MKYIQTTYSSIPTESVYYKDITNRRDDVPTWQFSNHKCDVCKGEIRQQIAHGYFLETCTVLQLNGYEPMPIHTKCLDEKLKKDAEIEPNYWDDFDYSPKELHSSIHKIVKRVGWKDFATAVKKYSDNNSNSNYKISITP